MLHQALRRLGDVLVGQGANDTALSILEVALEGFTQMDVHQSRAECMQTMGHVSVQCGDIDRAREMWESARPLFERAEQKKEVARLDKRLESLNMAQKLEDVPKIQLTTPPTAQQRSDVDREAQKPPVLTPEL
jgi:predicted negative regulator of RcsB-dependent stress response